MPEKFDAMRQWLVASLNANPREREQLEVSYGKVWDTEELKRDFEVHSFLAPFVSVTRKSDGRKGALTFQHLPRFYFEFMAE